MCHKIIADEKINNKHLAGNRIHQKAVNQRVLAKFVAMGIPKDKAREVIEDIIKNQIAEITVNY